MARCSKWTPEIDAFLLGLTGRSRDKVAALRDTFGIAVTKGAMEVHLSQLRKYARRESPAPAQLFQDRVTVAHDELLRKITNQPEDTAVHTQAFNKLLLDMLERTITPLTFTQPPYTPPKPATSKKQEDAVLIISDWHFGKETPCYNMEIAARRFTTICRKVRDITELHRHAYPINRLHIIWAGDLVDGTSIYPTQAHHVCGPVIKQIYGTLPTVVGELANLAGCFREVHNYCIRGNHGRVSKFAHEDDNFDRILFESLRLATTNVPGMYWEIPDGWYHQAHIGGLDFLITHGDQVKMVLNLPWYGITTRASRWKTTNQLGRFDVLVMGHFHAGSHLNWNNVKIFCNGTAASGDEFALEKIGMESTETQWFFGVSDERLTWNYELDFKE